MTMRERRRRFNRDHHVITIRCDIALANMMNRLTNDQRVKILKQFVRSRHDHQ